MKYDSVQSKSISIMNVDQCLMDEISFLTYCMDDQNIGLSFIFIFDNRVYMQVA